MSFDSVKPKFTETSLLTNQMTRSVGSEINTPTRIPIHCTKSNTSLESRPVTTDPEPLPQIEIELPILPEPQMAELIRVETEPAPTEQIEENTAEEDLNMSTDLKQNTNEILLEQQIQADISIGNQEADLVKSQPNMYDSKPSLSSSSSLEMDEVEIIIDLTSYNEIRQIEQIDERLKNIVMHMIPTTRKAYVDDICDGIKSLLSGPDLSQIRSPIDLPNRVIKFVQKRYSSLLNEYEPEGTEPSNHGSVIEEEHKEETEEKVTYFSTF